MKDSNVQSLRFSIFALFELQILECCQPGARYKCVAWKRQPLFLFSCPWTEKERLCVCVCVCACMRLEGSISVTEIRESG